MNISFFNIKIVIDTRLISFSHKFGVKVSEFRVKLPLPHAIGRYGLTRRVGVLLLSSCSLLRCILSS